MVDKFLTGARVKTLTNHVFQKLEDYSRTRHSNVVSIFRDVDKDQSGSLTTAEMKRALTGWGIPLHDEEFGCLVKTFDEDGDGELSFGEIFGAISVYKSDKRRGARSCQPFNPRELAQRYTPGFHTSHVQPLRMGPSQLRRAAEREMMARATADRMRRSQKFTRAPGSERSKSDLGFYPGMANYSQKGYQPDGNSFASMKREVPHRMPGR